MLFLNAPTSHRFLQDGTVEVSTSANEENKLWLESKWKSLEIEQRVQRVEW